MGADGSSGDGGRVDRPPEAGPLVARHVPRAPREGINVSPTHPLKEAAWLIVGINVVIALVFTALAVSVDVLVPLIPPEREAAAFAFLELPTSLEGVEDERAPAVQALLDRLVAHWDDAAYDFRVVVLPTSETNAAALPGGVVMVTSGLLDEVESENELAFVLGHELGHLRHRDHLRRLGRGAVYSLALTVVGVTAGSSPDLLTISQGLTARGFDRGQESDADRFGLQLVHAEYGHLASSWQFLERLAGDETDLDSVVAYLSTHPASLGRIERLEAYALEAGWPLEGEVVPMTLAPPAENPGQEPPP